MNHGFVSFEKESTQLIEAIVKDPELHGRWLNTLSYLENCGARMIAAREHPTQVKEEMLKHAAEEFRHAFYLKQQLPRLGKHYEDYRQSSLLGSWPGYRYLSKLNLQVCLYLRSLSLSRSETKPLAYVLVTYAIELRAQELYPVYQSVLNRVQSKIRVQSILLEEEEHLREMEEALDRIPTASLYIETVCGLESCLFGRWLKACQVAIYQPLNEAIIRPLS